MNLRLSRLTPNVPRWVNRIRGDKAIAAPGDGPGAAGPIDTCLVLVDGHPGCDELVGSCIVEQQATGLDLATVGDGPESLKLGSRLLVDLDGGGPGDGGEGRIRGQGQGEGCLRSTGGIGRNHAVEALLFKADLAGREGAQTRTTAHHAATHHAAGADKFQPLALDEAGGAESGCERQVGEIDTVRIEAVGN